MCLDVCGLAANLFRRNTPIIKVPTTVMAAVDASVGIKTAVKCAPAPCSGGSVTQWDVLIWPHHSTNSTN